MATAADTGVTATTFNEVDQRIDISVRLPRDQRRDLNMALSAPIELPDGQVIRDSAAIVDPPRSGMTPKALRRLIALAPANILYVSCNPAVFVRELPAFLETYRLDSLQAIDMFPHTAHLESIALFERSV